MESSITRKVCPERDATALFLLCTITYIIALLGRMSYTAVMADLITTQQLTHGQAGMVGTMMFASYGICQVLSGLLGDRISPRTLVFTGVVGSALMNLGVALFPSFTGMMLCWAGNGAFQSLIWSPIARILAEMLPPSMRKRACANIGVAFPLATILVYLLSSLFLHFTSWKFIFFFAGGSMLGMAGLWFWRMSNYMQKTEQSNVLEIISLPTIPNQEGGGLVRILLFSGAGFALFGAMTSGLLRDGIQSWTPTFFTERFGVSASLSVALAIALPIVNILGVFCIRWLYEHHMHNEMRGANALFFVGGIAILLLLMCSSFGWFVPAMLVMPIASTCMMGAGTMFVSFMPIHFGKLGKASSATGILNCACYVGSALSSYGIGHIAEVFGWNISIICWIACLLLAMLFTHFGAKKWEFFISGLY